MRGYRVLLAAHLLQLINKKGIYNYLFIQNVVH